MSRHLEWVLLPSTCPWSIHPRSETIFHTVPFPVKHPRPLPTPRSQTTMFFPEKTELTAEDTPHSSSTQLGELPVCDPRPWHA